MAGSDKSRPPADPKREGGLALDERTKTRRPPLFKVLLHNDDYTTKEFVVMILQVIFNLSEVDATTIMLHVHNNGVGVAGVYPYEVAETKVAKVMQVAKRFEFPLQCTLEPE